MKAKISISNDSSSIHVTVDNEVVFKKPYVKIAIRSLSGILDGCNLTIPVVDETKLLIQYADAKDIFIEAGCEIEVDASAIDTVDSLESSEAEFYRSCAEARSVWEGNLELEKFKEYSKKLQDLLKTRTLRDKQLLSSYHLAATSAACNFSVPGAGKTTMVLGAYAYLNSLPESDPRHVNCIFVVGPIACFEAWETDFAECFSRPAKSIRFLSSLTQEEKRQILIGINLEHRDDDLYLAHFQTFSIYEHLFKLFLTRPDRRVMFVIDEAHNIKGGDGVWANAALRLAKYASARVILTGTPAPNGYEDLKNLFDFIHPERDVLGFSRPVLRLMSEGKISPTQLQEKSKPFFTRVRKVDLKIPPPTFKAELVFMSPLQEEIYRAIESKVISDLDSGNDSGRKKIFQAASMIRLRQAASNPRQLSQPLSKELFDIEFSQGTAGGLLDRITQVSDMLDRFSDESDLPKLDKLVEICRQAEKTGEKVLIWSYFISNINLILKALQKNLSAPLYTITGATPVEQEATPVGEEEELSRGRILNLFRHSSGAAFLIATPQCLGESVSLHHWCHKAIYFDRDFNCGLFIQSKDRIHRFGLKSDTKTEYIYLISANSIDENIDDKLATKELRMNKLIDSEGIPLLTEDFFKDQDSDIQSVLDSYAKRGLL